MENSALIKLLLQSKLIENEDEVAKISKKAELESKSFLSAFLKYKKIEQSTVGTLIASKLQLPFLDLDFYDHSYIPSDVDYKIVEKYKVFPLKKNNNIIYLATSIPISNSVLADLKFQIGIPNINLVISEEEKLNKNIEKYLQGKSGNFAKDLDMEDVDLDIQSDLQEEQSQDNDVEDAPVVKFVNALILEAIKMKASDIHFEPYEKNYRVRYRVDGSLYESKKAPVVLKEKIASRIKIISNLDISEKRVPQDGKFKLKISSDRAIDFRVSTLPTLWGEKIVIRILDSSPSMLDLDKLGYSEEQKKVLVDAVSRPYGMVLVTGPTGSGKTVSLYSCLNLLNKEDVNICTAEDPAEINLQGVNQVSVNEKAGLTFAASLRSFLRQDPDIILVGEIRDLETADIAIKAAQTGHMVLSTLHTNDAPKTISRLMNMGVKPFNIASSVILITAQRLARKLCPHCKAIDDSIPQEVLIESGMPLEHLEGYQNSWHLYKPVGCDECNESGYKGRVGIYQVLPITEEIKKIILREGSELEIANVARQNGVLGLRESGLLKAKEGITSLAEVLANTNIE